MSWLGAGLGAGIGFAIGGPIGAGIGLWLGSSVSKNVTKKRENQTVFFVLFFSMMAKMAKADGVIDKSEIVAITAFMDNMRLDSEDRSAAMTIFRNAKDNDFSIYDYADQYREISSVDMREMAFSALWEVAHCDGILHAEEERILRTICQHLGINPGIYDNFAGGAGGNNSVDIDEYYAQLGCDNSCSDAEVKRSYKKSMANFHPDKIQSKGLPKEFVKFANEKTKKINEAYTFIKKSRGM